jgi:Zn finger protein HypA/HybF involved in hydrogenase expression
VPRLTPQQAADVAALESDPDYITYIAVAAFDIGSPRDKLEALLDGYQLWTTWSRNEVKPLLPTRQPEHPLLREALIDGLKRRVGRVLGPGETFTFELLTRLYQRAGGDKSDIANLHEHPHLRVCSRCKLVTRGKRTAARCPKCRHLHTDVISESMPRLSACPECHARPVTDWQARCETCAAERMKAKKARQARRRRARRREQPAAR